MKRAELDVFDEMPFIAWAKDASGTYVWGNRVINEFAQQNVEGKRDDELTWAGNADHLRKADEEVFRTGRAQFVHEHVDESGRGKSQLSVCKWLGHLDGVQCAFGVSFVIDD